MIVTSKSFSLSDVHYPAIHSHNADVEKFHGVILCDRCQCHPHSNSDCNQLAFCRRFLCSCGFNILITNVHERTPLSPNNAPCEPSSTPYLLFRTTALTTCQGWCHSLTKNEKQAEMTTRFNNDSIYNHPVHLLSSARLLRPM